MFWLAEAFFDFAWIILVCLSHQGLIKFADRFFMFFLVISAFYFFLNLVENFLLYFTLNGKK